MSITMNPDPVDYADISTDNHPLFRLLVDVKIDIDFNGDQHSVTIPARFETDFGSVPAVFDWLVPPLGVCDPAYLLHDGMFSTLWMSFSGAWDLTMHEANEILRSNLEWRGLSEFRSEAAFLAVDLCGASHWRVAA